MTRWQVPVVLAAVVAGTVIGLAIDVGTGPERLVVPALVGLLAVTFVGIDPAEFSAHVRPHKRVLTANLVLNFAWAPAAAWALGALLLAGHVDLRIGLVMLLVTPCTDWYLVFIATARGNVALGAALLPINFVLQLALLPIFVALLAGGAADIPLSDLVVSVVVVLGIPAAIAALTRSVAAWTRTTPQLERLTDRLQWVGLAFLAIAVTAIFATHAQVVVDEPATFLRLLAPLGVFFAATYLLTTVTARVAQLAHPERVTLTMTAMARNSPIALAIATAAFPDRPLIALALVIGPLIELPVLALTAQALNKTNR